jgi:hypothetical protein
MMYHPLRKLALGVALVLAAPAAAYAGMPSIGLSDVARLRLQNVSFFLAVFLLASFLIQQLWNYLRRDFAFLPRLSYPRAVGLVGLWGLLFVLVLTMISGARELLTPGAWEKQGLTYRLAQPAPAAPEGSPVEERRRKLDRLREALWDYARAHDMRLPSERDVPDVPKECWEVPDPSGMRYLYVGGQTANRGARVLAYEPELFGAERFVLFANGSIGRLDNPALERALKGEGP